MASSTSHHTRPQQNGLGFSIFWVASLWMGAPALAMIPHPGAPPSTPFLFDDGGPDPAAAICLPLYMVQDPVRSPVQTWWALANGVRPLEIFLTAVSVNAAESGRLQGSLWSPFGAFLAGNEVRYPADGSLAAPVLAEPLPLAEAVYRVEVRNLPDAGFPTARHYQLSVRGAALVGSSGPLPPQAESEDTRWRVHADAGETLGVGFVPAPEATATRGRLDLVDPGGVVRASTTIGGVASVPAAAAGPWRAVVSGLNGHYLLAKGPSVDRAIYAAWDTAGAGSLVVRIVTDDGSPNTRPFEIDVRASDGSPLGHATDVLSSIRFDKLLVGTVFVGANDAPSTPPEADRVPALITCNDEREIVLRVPAAPPNAPPDCSTLEVPDELWPPNHGMVAIDLSLVRDPEGDPVSVRVLWIRQDEPTDASGDGATERDGDGVGTPIAQLRAERSGSPRAPGDGRVYEFAFQATDALGASCQGTALIGVPHDQGRGTPAIDSDVRYDSTVAGGLPLP